MDKYTDNSLVEPMDDIILLNDNYKELGLKKGYIGTVVDNYIDTMGVVLVDFWNPLTNKYIVVQAEINREDFRVPRNTKEDRKYLKEFINMFKTEE